MAENQSYDTDFREALTKDKLYVYAVLGKTLPSLEALERKIERLQVSLADEDLSFDNLQTITRPQYGLKFKKIHDDGVFQFVQDLPTYSNRTYYFVKLDDTATLYADEHESGISVFVVSSDNEFETNYLASIMS